MKNYIQMYIYQFEEEVKEFVKNQLNNDYKYSKDEAYIHTPTGMRILSNKVSKKFKIDIFISVNGFNIKKHIIEHKKYLKEKD